MTAVRTVAPVPGARDLMQVPGATMSTAVPKLLYRAKVSSRSVPDGGVQPVTADWTEKLPGTPSKSEMAATVMTSS